ncbi:hypothetical protein [Streptomyces formicae]
MTEPLSGQLPDRLTAGQQHDDPTEETVDHILKQAVLDIATERAVTSFRSPAPVPAIGDAPPVEQPGRPAMSQKATDASVMMIAGGFLSLCVGGAGSALLYFSGTADPVVVGLLTAAPPAAFLSVRALVRGFRQAAPPEIHNHYDGTVYQDQRHVHSSTRGMWAKTNNNP